ncbi:MAG: AfsR/SARP family transcriptional regulator, partial [Natronosporangium sp.]
MEFGVLGPLQVRHAGEKLPLGTPQQQLVLVLLVVNLGRAASLEGVIYELWGETPPPSAVAKVRAYAAALRRLFESVQPGVDRIIRAGSGYLLNVDDSEVDLGLFSQDVGHGRRALAIGDLPAARDSFERGLARWRGTMLDGLPRGPLIASRCSTVEQDRLAVIDSLTEIHLRQGQPAQASALISPQVHAEPLREQSYALLMRARYQVDGVAAALDVYETLRRSLADQLGIEPGAELQRLHRAVLNRDAALEPPPAELERPEQPEQPEQPERPERPEQPRRPAYPAPP